VRTHLVKEKKRKVPQYNIKEASFRLIDVQEDKKISIKQRLYLFYPQTKIKGNRRGRIQGKERRGQHSQNIGTKNKKQKSREHQSQLQKEDLMNGPAPQAMMRLQKGREQSENRTDQ